MKVILEHIQPGQDLFSPPGISDLELGPELIRTKHVGRWEIPQVILQWLAGGLVDGRLDVESPKQPRGKYEQRILRQVVPCTDTSPGAKTPVVAVSGVLHVDALASRHVVGRGAQISIGVETMRLREHDRVKVQRPHVADDGCARGDKVVFVDDVALF